MAEYEAPGGFGQFLRSALSAGTQELIGIEPSLETQLYRAANPIGGIGSSLVGFLTPAVGVSAALSRVPVMARRLSALGAMEAESPFVARGLAEAIRFAPFEVGRTITSAIAGDHTRDVAIEAAINLGGAYGLGGVIGALRGGVRSSSATTTPSGTTDVGRLAQIIPEWDIGASPQEKLTLLRAKQIEMPDHAELIGRAIRDHTEAALKEVPADKAHLGLISGDKDATRTLDRLFNVNTEGEIRTRNLLIHPTQGFKDQLMREGFLADIAMPNLTELAQTTMFPRLIGAQSAEAAKKLDGVFRSGFWNRADDWMYVREEGKHEMVVMAKKVVGDHTPRAGDEYVMFKTPVPQTFLKGVDESVKNVQAIWNRIFPIEDLAAQEAKFGNNYYWQTARQHHEIAGSDAMTSAIASARPEEINNIVTRTAKRFADLILPQRVRTPMLDEFGRVNQIAREYIYPTEFQLTQPRARSAYTLAKTLLHAAEGKATELFFGSTRALRTPFRYILNVPQRGGLDAKLETLRGDPRAILEFQIARARNMGPAEAEAAGFSQKAIDVIAAVSKIDTDQILGMALAADIAGKEGGFKPMAQHVALRRSMRGEFRAEILGEGEKRYSIIGGRTAKEAFTIRDEMIKELNDRGLNMRAGKEWTAKNRRHDEQEAAKVVRDARVDDLVDAAHRNALQKMYDPALAKQPGVKLLKGDFKPLSLDETKEMIRKEIMEMEVGQAHQVFQARAMADLQKLGMENPTLKGLIDDKLDKLWGGSGRFGQVVDEFADNFLKPYVGPNSATKIAQWVNGVMYPLSFGFANLAFPALNAMTMITTAPAELAFIATARPQTVMKFYNMISLLGPDGLPRKAVGMLDMFRLMRESFRDMGKPLEGVAAEHYARAAREGKIDPHFMETTVGENSRTARNLRGVLKGETGILPFLGALSSYLPVTSEKFSRVWAFQMGRTFGEGVLGIKDPERLYQFASRFLDRTMYSYSTPDRAKLFTGPLGSVVGLYKNWMMHYVGNWMVYAGEGFGGNKWKPLLWATGTAWATGGILGMGPSSVMVDGAARVLGNKSTTEELYELFGGKGVGSDAFMYGLPGLFGLSLAQSGSAPGSEPIRDIGFMFNMAMWDRAKAASKAMGNAWDSLSATGQHPVTGPLVGENLMRAFAPRTIYRSLSLFEDSEIKSLSTGNPLVNDVNFIRRSLYTLGLNPIEVENTMGLARELWSNNAEMKNKVAWFARRWNAAEEAGDHRELNRIMATTTGIGIFDRVLRSAKTREARQERDILSSATSDPSLSERRANLGISP